MGQRSAVVGRGYEDLALVDVGDVGRVDVARRVEGGDNARGDSRQVESAESVPGAAEEDLGEAFAKIFPVLVGRVSQVAEVSTPCSSCL